MLRSLIVDDDFNTRNLLQHFLSPFCSCDIAVDGRECLDAFTSALAAENPYDLICLDIDMPQLDGHQTLVAIRELEASKGIFVGRGAKVIMTSAHREPAHVMGSFHEGCEGYLMKPILRERVVEQLAKLGILADQPAG